MTKPRRVRHTIKARALGAFILLSGLLITLFAAAVLLAPSDRVLAQQSAQANAQTQVMTVASANHTIFPGQVVTQTFTIPDYESAHLH